MLVTKFLESLITDARRVIKVRSLGRSAARTAHLVQPFGEDSKPIAWMPIYADTETTGQPIVIGFINPNVDSELLNGEKKIFSTNENGEESFYLLLKNDGTSQIGGTGDYMVRYNELETAFNKLKEDHNKVVTKLNSIITAFTTWIVVPTDGGAALKALVGTLQQEAASTADITPAKIEEIETIPN